MGAVLLTDRPQRWRLAGRAPHAPLRWPRCRSWLAAVLLVLTCAPAAVAQSSGKPAAPSTTSPAPSTTSPAADAFAPSWRMLAGFDVFAAKGCGRCHALRGVGPVTGPDLARVRSTTGFYDIGAALWNHLPRMAVEM